MATEPQPHNDDVEHQYSATDHPHTPSQGVALNSTKSDVHSLSFTSLTLPHLDNPNAPAPLANPSAPSQYIPIERGSGYDGGFHQQ